MDKRFWAIIGVIVAVFASVIWFNSSKDNGASAGQPTHHVRGKTDSKVTLIEYGDFQCPVCGAYYPAVEQTFDKYKDTISFQFVHYPITQLHQNAVSAARAAEAASNQGKFWEMYNLLFQNQQAWSSSNNPSSIFEGYARQLQLNITTFKKDYASSQTNDRINADKNAFNKTGLRPATPTFTLNGKQIKPANTAADFSKFIDAELKKQGITPPPATPAEQPTPQQ